MIITKKLTISMLKGMKAKASAFPMVARPFLPLPLQGNNALLLAGLGARYTDAASRTTLIHLHRRIRSALVAGSGPPLSYAARSLLLILSLLAVMIRPGSAQCPSHALTTFAPWV